MKTEPPIELVEKVVQAIIDADNGENGMHDIARAAIAAMGDASNYASVGSAAEAVKMLEATSPAKYATVERTHTKPGPCGSIEYGFVIKPSDISAVKRVARAIQKEIWGKRSLDSMDMTGITHKRISHEAAMAAIAAMPIPVSVEVCAKAACVADGFNPDGACTIQRGVPREQWEPYIKQAKAVLDAAGVKYVD